MDVLTLLVGRHIVIDFFLRYFLHLAIVVLTSLQQAVCFLCVTHELIDELSIFAELFIS